MSVTHVLAALAAIVLIGLVAFLLARSRRSRSAAEPSVAPPPLPGAIAAMTQDDSDATRVYVRQQPAAGPAAARSVEAQSATLRGACLVGLNGKHKGHRFPVATGGTTIGRSSSCDIMLADACVSSRHAWIGSVDGKIVLRDLQSTNGTFLNAQLHTPISEANLRSGDTIFIGGHLGEQFRFELD